MRWHVTGATVITGSKSDITKHYNHYYEQGASEWRRLGAVDKARNIVDISAGRKFGRVLEIGAGDGAILEQLSEVGFSDSMNVLEVSESAIEVIQNRGIENLHDVILFDGYEAPVKDGAYDLAILSHVVEHVEHPRGLLREASRVGKFVYVEVPLELKLRAPHDFQWTDTGHINIFSPLTIRHLVQSTGLEILEEQVTIPSYAVHRFNGGTRAVPKFAVKWTALRLMPRLATHLFTYHWSALCRSSGE